MEAQNLEEELDEELDEEFIKQFDDASEFDVEEEFEDDGDEINQFDDAFEEEEEEEEEEDESRYDNQIKTIATDNQINQEGRKRLKYRADDYEYGDLGFPDDGYDYSQHLKKHDDEGVFIPIRGTPTAFEKSLFEQPKVIIPQTSVTIEDIDPEILEALNQDFDDAEDGQEWGDLLDNFVETAGGVDDLQIKEDDYFKPLKDEMKVTKKIKKKIGKKIELPPATNYTDASNDATSFNERFAAVAETYKDEDIGDLEGEEIEGTINVNTLTDIFDEFEESQKMAHPFDRVRKTPLIPKPSSKKDAHGRFFEVLASIKERSGATNEDKLDTEDRSDEEESSDELEEIIVPIKKDWDCESVVSSFTSTENQCRLIKEPPKGAHKIALSKKTGLPIGVRPSPRSVKKDIEKLSLTQFSHPDPSYLDVTSAPPVHQSSGKGQQQPTEEAIEKDEGDSGESIASTASTVSIRPPNETPEERKLRKQLTKQSRKANRERKKNLKTRYHNENLRLRNIVAQQPFQNASVLPIQ